MPLDCHTLENLVDQGFCFGNIWERATVAGSQCDAHLFDSLDEQVV